MGWGTAFLFAQSSLFRIVTHHMLIVIVIYSWGAAAPQTFGLWLSCVLASFLWQSGCLTVVFISLTNKYARIMHIFFVVIHS